jgi:2-amino-4-hydroxy-6-hydroxymethyldihydropteridine diphosphokinase
MTTCCVIALGSNIPDRLDFLQRGVNLLRTNRDINVIKISRVYESDPVGEGLTGDFLNAVVVVDTSLSPRELLNACRDIEKQCGRHRNPENRNRTLDLDIIFFADRKISETGLTIPHPMWRERSFVVMPLRDVRDQLDGWQKGELETVEGNLADLTPCRPTLYVLD